MKPEELEDLKVKIKTVMVQHLNESIGYPDCQLEEIIFQLKPMWRKLEEAGLLVKGMSYRQFCSFATNTLNFELLKRSANI